MGIFTIEFDKKDRYICRGDLSTSATLLGFAHFP